MYLLSGILLFLYAAFFLHNQQRKKKILQKLCHMDNCEKAILLNDLVKPFGFSYDCQEDIMTSTLDAWQRQFGYCALFDRSAPRFNMIIDCEPICFCFQDQTWLIELWKGQYGINTGAEIGIYQADGMIDPADYEKTLFHSISDSELLSMSMELFCHGKKLFCMHQRHWWLTGFCMGRFSKPKDLTLKCSITFPNRCMLQSFVEALIDTGYEKCELSICDLTVTFCFDTPRTIQPKVCPLLTWWSSLQNRLFCRLYRFITRPFFCTLDQILYLYFYLPAAFRHMLRLKRMPGR